MKKNFEIQKGFDIVEAKPYCVEELKDLIAEGGAKPTNAYAIKLVYLWQSIFLALAEVN